MSNGMMQPHPCSNAECEFNYMLCNPKYSQFEFFQQFEHRCSQCTSPPARNWQRRQHFVQFETQTHGCCADVLIFNLDTGSIALGNVISDTVNDYAASLADPSGSLMPVINYSFLQPSRPQVVSGTTKPMSQAVLYVETLMRLGYYAAIIAYGGSLPGFGAGVCQEGCVAYNLAVSAYYMSLLCLLHKSAH